MRTTLELPDDLMRSIKVRAAQTDHTLTEVIAELLRSGLSMAEAGVAEGQRVQLPLVRSSRTATPAELSPERIAAILQASEVADLTSH